MSKTNLKIEYILKASNNIEFDNIDTYISRKIFEHYNKIPTYTLEDILTILNISKLKFKHILINWDIKIIQRLKMRLFLKE